MFCGVPFIRLTRAETAVFEPEALTVHLQDMDMMGELVEESAREIVVVSPSSAECISVATTAPVDGFVTNLNLRLGDQAVTNQPALALVDVNSFWVHGFFKETVIENIRPGDRAIITLMSYPGTPLE